jgi:hypothetical protein
MSHLSSGGDSYRPAPDGAIRFDNGARRRETLSVSSRADDPDYINTCQHESAHAIAGLGLKWDVTYCDAIRGQTQCLPPEGQTTAAHDWEVSIIAAAAKAFAGDAGYGFSDDERAVRDLGQDWDAALRAARKLAGDSNVRETYNQIVGALIVNGRLEAGELGQIWDGAGM